MSRPKLNALPQDSVLRAHLRRQADWPDEAPRLVRDTSRRMVYDLNDAVDRIGRANRLKAEAEALRASAERAGYAMQPEVAAEIERLEQEAAALAGQGRAGEVAPVERPAARPDVRTTHPHESRRGPRSRRRGRARGGRP
jgi:hypothetical protein